VVGGELEAELLTCPRGDAVEQIGGEVHDGAAPLADGVVVGLVGQVVGRWSVAEVDMDQDAGLLEGVEGAVHGREGDVGAVLLHPVGQLVDRQVLTVGVEQELQHGAACGREPAALLAHPLEELVQPWVLGGHGRRVTRP